MIDFNEQKNPVVLFDGVCNYCNTMVNFAISNDKKGTLKFASLQSDTGKELRNKFMIEENVDSLVFIENGKAFIYARAALGICKYLDWPAKALYAFAIIPSFISNPIYKWVAKNRYKWFGKKDTCMIPSANVRERFLD